ncbi:MAG: right-handed parallel beta-helix repeat-containing protein [Polyangiaceae bacterium]|nr:right-handed parallel beta-helix repeat-containing protein [Polyangiaceae bacterium]
MNRNLISWLVVAGVFSFAVGCGGGSAGDSDAEDGFGGEDAANTGGEDGATGGEDASSGGNGAGANAGGDGAGASTGGNGAGAGASTGGSDPGNSGGGGGSSPPVTVDCTHVGSGTDYQVGPGKAYENIGDVPFESLVAGDTVRIFHRAEPYREKMMIAGVGTADQPVRVCGVAGPNGELPVIDGNGATTRPQMDFPFNGHQPRGLIIIGHAHDRPYEEQPSHIVVEGLELTGASPENTFTDKSGAATTYGPAAAGIFVQRGDDITVRGCAIHENNNGIFMGTGSGVDATRRVLIEANHIYLNGSLTDFFEHNVYNEVEGITYQFNHFGRPRAGANGVVNGANIKDRSAGTVIRYNWIEDGGHLIDLVEAQEAKAATLAMPSFHESFVYGNVLVRNGTQDGSMVHYGGDSGTVSDYRKGTLRFYQNTVVVKNAGAAAYDRPAVFELSTNDEHLEATNNIFFSTQAGTELSPIVMLGRRDGVTSGIATFTTNWVSPGWTPWDQTPGTETQNVATAAGLPSPIGGTDPGFTNAASDDYTLKSGAPVIGVGTDLASSIPPDLAVTLQYAAPQHAVPRAAESPATLGAMGAP